MKQSNKFARVELYAGVNLNKPDFGEPLAVLCSSEKKIASILEKAADFSSGGFVLLLKRDEKLLKRLIPAYINAKIRNADNEMRAKTLPMEMLLFVSGTMRTDKAIKENGASDNKMFIAFTDNRKRFGNFALQNNIKIIKEYVLDFSKDIAEDVTSLGFLEAY